MRIFLDANVLFSAANRRSSLARLVDLVVGRHAALTSDLAVEEAGRNVRNKRPTWLADFDSLAMRVEVVDSAEFPLPVDLVEKDRPILCAAVRAGCDLLVTGDRRHFGHLYDITVLGVRVVTLARLAELLVAAESQP